MFDLETCGRRDLGLFLLLGTGTTGSHCLWVSSLLRSSNALCFQIFFLFNSFTHFIAILSKCSLRANTERLSLIAASSTKTWSSQASLQNNLDPDQTFRSSLRLWINLLLGILKWQLRDSALRTVTASRFNKRNAVEVQVRVENAVQIEILFNERYWFVDLFFCTIRININAISE